MARDSEKTRWLVLVPTAMERRELVGSKLLADRLQLELCGFGPIVPAARTVQLIHEHSPERVLLLGIAGRYDSRLEIGGAYSFDRVSCDGVGVGSGDSFETASEMGWQHWDDPDRSIGDTLSLARQHSQASRSLLTVCSAAKTDAEVAKRKIRFPDAAAEDMEAFSVAAAGLLCHVPVHVVRGISNQAGDRNHRDWKIVDALTSAAILAQQLIDSQP